jgi:hypothetical protein
MSFNLHGWFKKQYLKEESGFEKNQWVNLTDDEKDEFAEELFDLINTAYAPIGGHPNYKSPADIIGAERDADYMVIDLDDDPEFDALKVSKKKEFGNKSVAMGHDGSAEAKRAAINITVLLLKQPGYFVEVSGKLKDILQSKGAPIITDEKIIRKILKGKDIEMNDDGSYQREIGGKIFTKILMGKPLIK